MLEREWKRLDKSPGIKLYAPNEATGPTTYSEWEIVSVISCGTTMTHITKAANGSGGRGKGYAVLPFQSADDENDVRQMAQGKL